MILLLSLVGCKQNVAPEASPEAAKANRPRFNIQEFENEPTHSTRLQKTGIRLTESAIALGLAYTYTNGERGKALLAETTGGGCGWLDFNNDGWSDLFVCQGGDTTAAEVAEQPSDQLFINLRGSFSPVTDPARIHEPNYSQGVAIADFDNDGFDDVYVTNVFSNTLWKNCGDGTFLEIAKTAGVADERWSTSAAWADLDLDGDLDLYVCNYCQYDPRNPKVCKTPAGYDTICNPSDLKPWPDACFVNQADGTFNEQSSRLGLHGPGNRALGVAIADFNNDQRPDIYVANDTTENFLFIQQSDQSFRDEAALRACAVDRTGTPQGSMGLAIGDYDWNGYLDIYCTHYFEESNTLYANLGDAGFRDMTAFTGLHRPTMPYLGFGASFVDLNADGDLELLVANGHVNNAPHANAPQMPAQAFSYDSTQQRWFDIGARASDYFDKKFMGRAVATADFDNDNDLDICIVNQNTPTALLQNDSSSKNFLAVRLLGTNSNRKGIGSVVSLTVDGRTLSSQLAGGTSYCATHEPIIFFGLDHELAPDATVELTVVWPGRLEPQKQTVVINQSIVLRELRNP